MIDLQIKEVNKGKIKELKFTYDGLVEPEETKQDIQDLYNFKCIKACTHYGNLDLPLIKACYDVDIKNVISFNYALTCNDKKNTYIHFYIDDYQFERIWANPEKYLNLFKEFAGVIMPDFSMYINMPKPIQIYNHYRNLLLASYYQNNGIKVIPNISWSDLESLNWCLTALPKHSIMAISTNGCLNNATKTLFKTQLKKVLEILQPTKLICVGTVSQDIKEVIPDKIQLQVFLSHLDKLHQKGGA